jgi:hypothetical protein
MQFWSMGSPQAQPVLNANVAVPEAPQSPFTTLIESLPPR